MDATPEVDATKTEVGQGYKDDSEEVSDVRIVEDVTQEFVSDREKAIEEIKNEVVNLSLSVAEKLIKKNISVEDNKALIDESLSQVKKYEA